ncbi:MAG: sigma 54-interacting transcriptional regulator, partial [Polyangiales bacterium]
MPRFAILPLFGPALVLYLIADVAALRGGFAASDYVLAGVIVLLAAQRRRSAPAGEAGHAERLIHALGLCAAVALLRLLGAPMQRLSVELAETLALGALGAIVLELALTLPNPWGPQRHRHSLWVANQVLAAGSVLLSGLALGPPLHVLGEVWLLPAMYAHAAAAYATVALFAAFVLRLLRRRWGSAQEVLAANGLALLGTAPALVLSVLAGFGLDHAPSWLARSLAAVAALTLTFGHRQLTAAPRNATISNTTRDVIALVVSLLAATSLVAAFPGVWPVLPAARAAFLLGTLLGVLALYTWLARGFRRVLAPDGGRLLAAISDTQLALARAQTLEALVTGVLAGFLRVHREGAGKPLLYGFDPAFEGRCDAAGAAHLQSRVLHPLIAERLRERPGELIIRSELEQQFVRQPALRPLLDAVLERDLVCVLPLAIEGELEGALLLPRGARRSPLTEEELRALARFGCQLAGLLAVFSAKARAEQRANEATLATTQAQAEIARLSAQVARLEADRALLLSERSGAPEAVPLVAYSEASRQLVTRLQSLASDSMPVLLTSEPGCELEPFARVLHTRGPFIVLDCAAVRAERAEVALFGGMSDAGPDVGCLSAAEGGSLCLLDLPALPLAAQAQLARALASGWVLSEGDRGSYPLRARLITSARSGLDTLADEGRFCRELAEQLSPVVCRVPPLRECGDDLGSLVLLALDRASRRQSRGALGIEPDALAALRDYDYPGNHAELEHIIDRAVAHARGMRLTLADLAMGRVLPARNDIDEWAAPFEAIERKALMHALARARGNKSEAARLLGMPRSTLLDKLR